ncbi:MAG: histidinol dehydrogenase, partial [Gammaproteobacteria bacterium]|nr:histidinol dehydrogenase [Gammaproteobacteria bacterium]
MDNTLPVISQWNALDDSARKQLLQRPTQRNDQSLRAQVADIISAVRANGDQALYRFSREFDQATLDRLDVPRSTIDAAAAAVSDDVLTAVDAAIDNITRFHSRQRPTEIDLETTPGVRCQRLWRPLDAVGLYVPGGSAPLISTVMMLAIPAQLAGVQKRVLCTPPDSAGVIDPNLLAVAQRCGVTDVFRVGGAQAIAALAYGTESIPRVSKIFGPGNSWVTMAKTLVTAASDGTACDMPAGPSEVMVIADREANPAFIAADLLSQAEHGPDSQVILLTDDAGLAVAVREALGQQLSALPRRAIASRALAESSLIVAGTLDDALDIANDYAPEHLIINTADPRRWLPQVRNAGSVFLGCWAPESVGDYCSGTNHVLPTYGWARSYSGLSVSDFGRTMTVQQLS